MQTKATQNTVAYGCAALIVVGVVIGIILLVGKACSFVGHLASAPPATSPDASDIEYGGQQQLKAALRDPDSVKFRNQFVSQLEGGSRVLCGEFNSKNGFGGYAGFRHFIAPSNPGVPVLIEGEKTGHGRYVDRHLFPEAYKRFCSHPVQSFP